MGLNDEERNILVQMQLDKVHKNFGQYHVATGIFSIEDGKHYSRMQGLREKSDYNCAYDVTKEDIEPKIEPTRMLIEKIEQRITSTSKTDN